MRRATTVFLAAGLATVAIHTSSPASASSYRIVYSFSEIGNEGANPSGTLINVGGTLYGTTYAGGPHGLGTVFALNPATGEETVVHFFAGGSDGAKPLAGLIDVDGKLFGTTWEGGSGTCSGGTHAVGCGTVFEIDETTGAETVVYSFEAGQGAAAGAGPTDGLIKVDGKLYGTTSGAIISGDYDLGTVFEVNPTTGKERLVYAFKAHSDGWLPWAGLTNVGGTLYGTTVHGGASNAGTVFAVNPKTGAGTVAYSFTGGSDGFDPYGGLINVRGTLYGTTEYGGAHNDGTVFAFDLASGAATVLYSFKGGEGKHPLAGLLKVRDKLYGTTVKGGAFHYGTVFALDPTTGVAEVLHSFAGSCCDGANPEAGLIDVGGTLYGTTFHGGSGGGSVFAITP